MVRSWHLAPALIDGLAARVRDALTQVPDGSRVLFTAHSLPARIVDMNDPYPDELRASAEAIAARAGVDDWSLGWQSAGRTPEPWLGPDLLESLRTLAAEGVPGVVVCPQGFTSDHLEVLYDVDIEAQRVAHELGLPLARTASINDDPAVMQAVAAAVRDAEIGRAA
jgi:ferrochelatase